MVRLISGFICFFKPKPKIRKFEGSIVDNCWTCGCGALNAAYRSTCGNCNKEINES